MTLNDVPLDLLRGVVTALDAFVQVRYRARLLHERAHLAAELQDTRAGLAEIQALAGGAAGRPEEVNDHAQF
jgi:hypothetical protein